MPHTLELRRDPGQERWNLDPSGKSLGFFFLVLLVCQPSASISVSSADPENLPARNSFESFPGSYHAMNITCCKPLLDLLQGHQTVNSSPVNITLFLC